MSDRSVDPWHEPLPPVVEASIGRHLLAEEKRLWHLGGKDSGWIHQALVATDRRLLIVKVSKKGTQESVRPFAYNEVSFVEVSFDWSGIFQVVRVGASALPLKLEAAKAGATSIIFDKKAAAIFQAAADSVNKTVTDARSRPDVVTISGSVPLRAEDIPMEIRKLTDLRDHGHISQREYDKKRLELLDRL